MKRLFLIATGLLMLVFHSNAQVGITKLLTENLVNPKGIDIKQPRFSWQLKGDQRGISQSAYEIILSKENKNLWNSGKVMSDQSVQVLYSGPALVSGTKYKWKVRVWDNNGKATPWSEEAEFLTGYFSVDDWKAKWIVPGYVEDSVLRPSPLFRREFKISKQIKSATLSITSHGMYVANINGKRVGDVYLTPGWTDYNYRLQYQVYDITRLLQGGENAIGVMLGSGWYRGILGFEFSINNYGKDIALLCQLDISYSDGSKESIISDPSWKSSTGEVRYAEIYNGETIDARLEKPGWTKSGFDDSGWSNVKQADFPMSVLLATRNEPVKKHESFTPVNIFTTPEGDQVMDFGQNIVGWVRVKVNGKAGDKVTLSHAEVLDKDGNFYTENLRSAKAQNSYILKGGEDEIFEPHFSWQGFRYVKVEGYPGSLRPENFTAFALYSDMSKTGSFTCSNDLINQLQHNIQWGQKGNFLDIPTDCPQRDERLG
ncbi:MAG: family 78 glycoside hydrolase catalytic domain, partial [Bacteroidales bacterium]|nr:family 78 glycoside hydrolase catalytic domain [Bacteroidales bacterium]